MRKLSQEPAEVRRQIKFAKREQRRGHREKARKVYQGAIDAIFGDHAPRINRFQAGVVMHQMGSIHAIDNDAKMAREYFVAAKRNFRDNPDPVARAILLRDWGNFELLEGNTRLAEKMIEQARNELRKLGATLHITKVDLGVEKAVTAGFLARIKIVRGDWTVETYNQLRELDEMLDKYGKKPVYQLANLGWLIDITDDKFERRGYIQKAIRLASVVGNVDKQREYRALLIGGEPLRQAYKMTVASSNRLQSFGRYSLNGVVRYFI